MKKIFYLLFVFPLLFSCVHYKVRVMDKPDNTSIEICKKTEYLGTHHVSLYRYVERIITDEDGTKMQTGQYIKTKIPKESFTYHKLLDHARTKYIREQISKDATFKESNILITNVKWDVKEFKWFSWVFWHRIDGVTYDVIKCE